MIHDPELVDKLSSYDPVEYAGEVFRATRKGLDPTAFSTSGGRWAPRNGPAVLYTSLEPEGALAEIAFHWGQFNPRPSKPAILNRLKVESNRSLRLLRGDLLSLDVEVGRYPETNYERKQSIGSAVSFLEFDGLLVPCARWDCENFVLFADNQSESNRLELIASEAKDWLTWARDNNCLPDFDEE